MRGFSRNDMTEAADQILIFNRKIRQAVAESDFVRAYALDQRRRSFIIALDLQNQSLDSAVRKAVGEAMSDLAELTLQLEEGLLTRFRLNIARARRAYSAQLAPMNRVR